MTASVPSARPRFETLNSFRGLAALLIAVFHFPAVYLGAESPFVRHAYVLTNLFFALSGFILMAAYGNRLSSLTSVRSFAWTRFVRLYPLHVLTTALVLAVPLIAYGSKVVLTWSFTGKYAGDFSYPAEPLANIVGDLFLLQGFGLFDKLHLNFPAWSMGAIFFCSLLFALVSLLPRGRLAAFVCLAIAPAALLAMYSHSFMGSSFDFGFLRAASNFFFGVLVWYVWKAWKPGVRSHQWAVFLQTVAVVAAAAFVSWVGIDTWRSMLSPLVWGLFLLVFTMDSGDYAEVLNNDKLNWLSERSYAIFMSHASLLFLGHQAMEWAQHFSLTAATSSIVGLGALVVYVVGVLRLSDVLHRYIQMPVIAWGNKTASSDKGKAVAASVPAHPVSAVSAT